jgi:hypothetical protein
MEDFRERISALGDTMSRSTPLTYTGINFCFLLQFHKAGRILMETRLQKFPLASLVYNYATLKSELGITKRHVPRQQDTPEVQRPSANCALLEH